jgi:gamma-glutamylputrescine oxidase
MSVSLWLDQSVSTVNEKEVDVLIIGAGIAGLSAAYWLEKMEPDLKIAIVEKGEMGSGATGRNAGFITCGSVEHYNRLTEKHGTQEAADIWRFSEENLLFLKEEIIQGHESELLFEHNGSFSLASKDTEFKELQESAKLMASQGIKVEVLEQKAIEERLKASGFVGGIKYMEDASVHPIKLLQKIRSKLKTTQIYENHEVFAIEPASEGKYVKTSKSYFKTSMVVMATNGYSALLHSYFEDKIYPTRGQILATEPVARFMEGPCYANFVLDYFRQLPTGQLVIGGFRQLQKDAEVGYSDQTSQIIQRALEDFIQEHLPLLKGKKITHRWSGIMGFSADGQPLVGSLSSDPSLYFVGGFTAHGLGLAFHSAKVLAHMICGDEKFKVPGFLNARRFS